LALVRKRGEANEFNDDSSNAVDADEVEFKIFFGSNLKF
jgi:hypothetical protein